MTSGRRFLIWYWSGAGGGGRFAIQLARRMSLAFGADRVSLSLNADYPLDESQIGVRVLRAPVANDRRRPWHTLIGLARSAETLAQHTKQSGADMVLAPMNFATALPLALSLRKPMVYFAHDPEPHPGDYAPRLQRLMQKGMMARARAVAALSQYGGDALRRQGVGGKLHIVPLGAVSDVAAAPRGAIGSRPVRLLFLGRLLPYKGLDLLADALHLLAGRADWRLTIAGYGPEASTAKARLQKLTQLDAFNDGWFSDERMSALLQQNDILLAPYISATQSGVVAEALALGVPVVATPVGALPEQTGAGRGGWIAKAPAAEAFAAALREALDQRATYAAKSESALALAREVWARDEWSWLERI